MQYLLLIYHNEKEWAAISEQERATVYEGYRDFRGGIVKSGNYKAGEKLEPSSTAATVRVRNGKVAVTDGPFAETREQLGGFFIIQAADLDEAAAIAAKIPSAKNGSVEVRPVAEQTK